LMGTTAAGIYYRNARAYRQRRQTKKDSTEDLTDGSSTESGTSNETVVYQKVLLIERPNLERSAVDSLDEHSAKEFPVDAGLSVSQQEYVPNGPSNDSFLADVPHNRAVSSDNAAQVSFKAATIEERSAWNHYQETSRQGNGSFRMEWNCKREGNNSSSGQYANADVTTSSVKDRTKVTNTLWFL
jgi:hypothetical protein